MRNLLLILILILCIVPVSTTAEQVVTLEGGSSHVVLNDRAQDGIIIDIDLDKLEFFDVSTKDGLFTLLSFEGCSRSQHIGEPNLPLINRLVSVPYGCELKVHILDYETETISLADYNITTPLMPVQPSVSKSDDPGSVPFEYNITAYERPGFYALPTADAQILGIMRSVNIARISISPIEYNPTENTIKVYKRLTIQVTYEHPDWGTTYEKWQRYYSPVFENVLGKVANYSAQKALFRDDLVTYPVKYAIVADRMFETQLQPFIEWKIKKGFNVVVAYTDVIGSTSAEVKSYLQGLYDAGTPDDPAPSFVLFVGDD